MLYSTIGIIKQCYKFRFFWRNSILFGGYFTTRAVCFYENKMTLVLTLYYHDREKWGIMLESVCKLRVL